ncbi:hypothetical protein SEPL_510 [Salmonella phage SE_PL]|nr:hypothetical protein 7t3_037 [Salmonella phage 7t3]QIG63123.1 hypothetical protein SEPL_510 [Salmonella phage SE_PL]
MENQHRKIKGYRELTEDEIKNMNDVKELAAQVGELIERLGDTPDIDRRWLNIAKTDLQKGFMSAVRSIAKPDSF